MKLKRNWLVIGLLVLALLAVTACSSDETAPVEEQSAELASDEAVQAEEPAAGDRTMRRNENNSTQLILGSFQLEDTE